MQPGLRTRVGGTCSGPCVHAGQQRTARYRRRHAPSIVNSLVSLDSRQQKDAQGQACTVSCCDSRGYSETLPCSGRFIQQQLSQLSSTACLVAAHQLLSSVHMQAHAAETVSPAAITLFREFLDQIDALGPWGGALFVLTVMCAEMIPLFPTQPLTLASGLLFGPFKGALFIVIANTLAAVNAYSLSKGIGRKLAEKMVAREAGEQQGPVQQQIAAVTQAIESGGWLRQVTAITLLRLTPVVPFSASNYLLGLTPVQLGPLVVGTVAGMSVWSVLYASLGGASKVLLESGTDLDVLMAGLVHKAGKYSEDVAVCGLGLGVIALAYYLLTQRVQSPEDGPNDGHHQQGLDVGQPAPREEVLQNK